MKARHAVLAAAMLLGSTVLASAQSTNHSGAGGSANVSGSEQSEQRGATPGSTAGMKGSPGRTNPGGRMGTTGMSTKGSTTTGGTSNNAGAGSGDQSGAADQKR